MKKSFSESFVYHARNFMYRDIFRVIEDYATGHVLDVGGRDFFSFFKKRAGMYASWTTVDINACLGSQQAKVRFVRGDGCQLPFGESCFDTILNIQVLEHVFHPDRMVREIARVLKNGGYAIFLIPQTAVLHEVPHDYYNFTRFWIERVMREASLDIIELRPLGGVWKTFASHFVYFFLKSFGCGHLIIREYKRNAMFYVLYPLMLIYCLVSIPICLFFSSGDLKEEANNHLVIARKASIKCKEG